MTECKSEKIPLIPLIPSKLTAELILRQAQDDRGLKRQRKAGGDLADVVADGADFVGVGAVLDGFLDQVRDVEHLVLLHAARGDGGRAEADAAGLEGALRVERNRVLVH